MGRTKIENEPYVHRHNACNNERYLGEPSFATHRQPRRRRACRSSRSRTVTPVPDTTESRHTYTNSAQQNEHNYEINAGRLGLLMELRFITV